MSKFLAGKLAYLKNIFPSDIYQAKCAKALFASAILWVSSFFLIAEPSLLAANINSSASFSAIGLPFFDLEAFNIHLIAKANFLSPLTSLGT